MANMLAFVMPVSEELIADGRGWAWAHAWVGRTLERRFTAEIFDEDWSTAEVELNLVELGHGGAWDTRFVDECEEW